MSNVLDLQALSSAGTDGVCIICLSWVSTSQEG